MVSGYLFKITGWQCNGWSKLESWGGKRSENVRGDKINDQCSPPSEMLLFFGAFYSVQSVRAFNLVAKLSPYKGELVRTGFCPYYYKWSWGRNEYLSSFYFPTTNSIFPYLYTGNLYVLNCQSDGMTWAFITKIHYPSWVMVAPSTPRVIIRRRVATPLNPTPETTQKNLGIQYFQACSPTPGLRVPFFFFSPLQALTLPYEVCWGCELSRLCSSAIFAIKF